jgi:hypothetical protein
VEKGILERGDIVQINPSVPTFGGCLMVVTESKDWGAHGFVQNAGGDGQAYVRCRFIDMEPTGGRAVWIPEG